MRGDYFDAALTRPIPAGVVTRVPGGGPLTSHFITAGANHGDRSDARLSYTDEVVIGFEHELRRTRSSAHYIHRNLGARSRTSRRAGRLH
jgi:hypothetical protein